MSGEEKIPFDLDHYITNLLFDEPFFAALSRRINKCKSEVVPTAGVRMNKNNAQFELYYNPKFFSQLSRDERLAVLKHEFYHLIFGHVCGRKPPELSERVWNFATDLAINSHIDNLPSACLKPGEGPFEDFPSHLSAEQYVKYLEKMRDDYKATQGSGGSGHGDETSDGLPSDGQFDSHDDWSYNNSSALDQQTRDIANERLKEYIKDAAKEAQKKGWGSVTSQMRETIKAGIGGRIDWRKVLRYFIKTSTRSSRSSTVKRLNKRYRYIHPGKKISRTARIAVSIDQSGSVDDDMLEAFFAELSNLAHLASFTVIPFDTEVDPLLVYEWKKGQRQAAKRVMRGGTDFDAPTEYVNNHGFDGHIILTDMMAPKPKPSLCQRMWMTTRESLRYKNFETNERVILIND